MLRTIGARLAAVYLLPSLLGLAALGWLVDALARRALEEELGRKVTAVAAAAAAVMPADRIDFLRPGDEGTRTWRNLRDRLEELRDATGVRRLALFGPDERALVDVGGDAAIGAPLPELARDRLELAGVFAGTAQPSQVLFEVDGALFKTGYAPVRDGDRVVAAVLAEGSAASFAVLRDFRASLLALGLAAAAGVVAVAFLFSRTLVAPIRRLAAAARRIGGGDLATPVPPAPTEELGRLASTLEEMREELRARDRQLQTMLAGIAHEVRNPLGGMELYSGLLLEDLAGEPARADQVRRIRREIEHLTVLVEEFLDFARERPPQVEAVELRGLLEEAAALTGPLAAARGVRVSVEAGEACARCDPAQVRRAVLNLARNAVQASAPGAAVRLVAEVAGETARLAVIDTGPGVAPADRERIFEPFFTTREKGTGLGLALARRIALAHGGRLFHEPTPGGGATFVIEWPGASTLRSRTAAL